VDGDGETYRLNLEYRLDPDKLIYATYSTGYRPGGVNRRGTLPPYEADYLTNYEFGWKTTFADAFRWNGAVFSQDWEDFQYAFIAPDTNGLTQIQNAGNARIQGVESDFTWLATDQLTLAGGVTLLDAKTTEETGFALEDTRLPVSPEVNASARYDFELGDWQAFFQAAAVYQGEAEVDLRTKAPDPDDPTSVPEATILGTLPSFTIVDLSAGVDRNGIRISAFLNNVFDERGVVARYTECAPGTCGGRPYDVPSQPRTLGVRFGKSF
jgi:iron complex outermembrane recepter protein